VSPPMSVFVLSPSPGSQNPLFRLLRTGPFRLSLVEFEAGIAPPRPGLRIGPRSEAELFPLGVFSIRSLPPLHGGPLRTHFRSYLSFPTSLRGRERKTQRCTRVRDDLLSLDVSWLTDRGISRRRPRVPNALVLFPSDMILSYRVLR